MLCFFIEQMALSVRSHCEFVSTPNFKCNSEGFPKLIIVVFKLNGSHDSLIHGLSMEQLKTKLRPVFERSLIITHSGNQDFFSLGFPKGTKSESLDTYDITSHFKRQDNSAIRLEVIYPNLFKKNFRQEGEAHDPQADAKAILEIYLFMRSHIKFSRYDDRGYYDEETWEYHPGY